MTTVLGVDLSYTGTGLALRGSSPGGWVTGLTTTEAERSGDFRRNYIATTVAEWATRDPDTLVVIEGGFSHGPLTHKIGMLHGAVRQVLYTARIPVATLSPGTLKKYATGKGTATKADMRMELFRRAGIDVPDDNLVDAMWLAAAGWEHLGSPLWAMPADRRAALAKGEWP